MRVEYSVWSDGHVLFLEGQGKDNGQLRVGKIETAAVDRLMAAFRESGFFDRDSSIYAVPDGGCVQIAARDGETRNLVGWDEVVNPNWGANIRPTSEYRRLQTTWAVVRKALTEAKPTHANPVGSIQGGNDALRGYVQNEPWRTPWLTASLWYGKSE
jgi:hypothetical protein